MQIPTLSIRPGTPRDIPAIDALMSISARELGRQDYPIEAVEAALASGAWGLDTQLIRDTTFYVVLVDDVLAACGGWSYRRTLYGADNGDARQPEILNPEVDRARIRAFFVHPCYARRGLGTLMLACCENAARIAGFSSFELAATAAGVGLYRANGYTTGGAFEYDVGSGYTMRGVLMHKR